MNPSVTLTVRCLRFTMTTEEKLDRILIQLNALGPIQASLISLQTSISDVKEELGHIQFTVNNHEDRLLALERDMVEQKIMANQQQQQLRSLTLRLMNFPEVIGEKEDNYAALRARVYEVVLKPLLTAAKAAKEITSVPQMATVIDSCFRPFNASATSSKGPPHVIIKVTSKPLKLAILRQKKNMVKLTTSPDGDKRFILVEDLTQDTHKVLTALSKSKAVDKVWTIDGTIKFTREGQIGTRTVRSVYDPLPKIINM